MVVRAFTIMLAALLVLPLLSDVAPVDARKKRKTVTRTYSNDDPLDAITFETHSSPITVRKLKKGRIKDVNVILRGFTHSQPGDVDVMLVGPNGENLLLVSDAGSTNDAKGLTFIIDDEATDTLPDSGDLETGSYPPTNYAGSGDLFLHPVGPTPPVPSSNDSLSIFDGSNPNGTWTLFVTDNNSGEDGAFNGGWSLQIKAKVKVKKRKR